MPVTSIPPMGPEVTYEEEVPPKEIGEDEGEIEEFPEIRGSLAEEVMMRDMMGLTLESDPTNRIIWYYK